MSQYRVHELIDTLSHTFTMKERVAVKTMRPLLAWYDNPVGTFTLTVKDSNDNTVASKSQTLATIKSASGVSDDYAVGWVSFGFDNEFTLYPSKQYTVELSSSGYTFSSSSFLAWGLQHEMPFNTFTKTENIDENPLALQVWGYKKTRNR